VVLQADIPDVGVRSAVRFVAVLLEGTGLAFEVIRNFEAVEDDCGVRLVFAFFTEPPAP
jgi:hypothetical protein